MQYLRRVHVPSVSARKAGCKCSKEVTGSSRGAGFRNVLHSLTASLEERPGDEGRRQLEKAAGAKVKAFWFLSCLAAG